MAQVTLFPPHQEAMNFEDAEDLTLNQGMLMFQASKNRSDPEDSTVARYITNMPFLWVE